MTTTDEAARMLKRMLANGPVTAMPKRPGDQALVAQLAAGRFQPGRDYRENEVNDVLKAWLETFSVPYGIDHVTLRRHLVDSRLLLRDKVGSTYRVNAAQVQRLEVDPVQVLEAARRERAARKQRPAG
jgi:hypothetical protein